MDKLSPLREECLQCQACPLGRTRTPPGIWHRNPDSSLLFVGEGPGEQEDLQGEPFVGRAGQLLDDMLELMDLDRRRVYITNIVKCRPPKNRDPLGEEQAACRPWLDRQMQQVQPKLVICLGRIAASAIIRPDFRITREHGQWFPIPGARAMAIYHPGSFAAGSHQAPGDLCRSASHSVGGAKSLPRAVFTIKDRTLYE